MAAVQQSDSTEELPKPKFSIENYISRVYEWNQKLIIYLRWKRNLMGDWVFQYKLTYLSTQTK